MGEPVTVEKFAVGQAVRRLEDPRLLRGFGRYSDDVALPRQAYAVVVRSPHAHARIRAVAAAALNAGGVIAVLTGEDLAADGLGNLPTDTTRKRRDGSSAFATPVAAVPLEPRAAVGEYDRRTGRYILHTGIQAPHGLRTLLADVLRVPQSHLRVVTGDVGGSFGMRSGIYPELALVLWAARRLGRPVKWTSSRREGFLTDEAGRDNVSTAELALDADGRFLAFP